jgi:branched-chain amino acid transport system ATP-binding protein
MTVRDNVAVGAMYGHARLRRRGEYLDAADEALQRTGLSAKAAFMPPHLTLSDRKRLEVARALAMKPRLLLLDEVMAGLNLTEIERIITLIREIAATGITVIVIEHVMKAVLALCDRAMVLNFGRKLTEGKPLDVINEPAVVEAYLGTRFAKSRAGSAA